MVSSASSGGSSQNAVSGTEEELQALMRQRKQKRMLSNRESARRSRMRKQKHLDDLMEQVSWLRKENGQILTALNVTSQNFVRLESENSILQAQMMELSSRLRALNEIIYLMHGNNSNSGSSSSNMSNSDGGIISDGFQGQPWSLMAVSLPITASANMFQY